MQHIGTNERIWKAAGHAFFGKHMNHRVEVEAFRPFPMEGIALTVALVSVQSSRVSFANLSLF